MNNKLFENAKLVGADISMFHAPDRKWKNYYYEDEKQNLLFLLPVHLFFGPIVVDLSWAKQATFKTKDGAIHRFRDYAWNMSSAKRNTSYPKTAVTDRSAKCGRRTILLNLFVLDHLFLDKLDTAQRQAVSHLNGNTLDCRLCNLSYGILKENNVTKYYSYVPEIKYPCRVWW